MAREDIALVDATCGKDVLHLGTFAKAKLQKKFEISICINAHPKI